MGGISFPTILDHLKDWMERKFEEEKICIALPECEGDKALCLDEFNFSLIRAAWDVMEANFCDMFSEFRWRVRFDAA